MVQVTNYDFIFISYDEDNADENWADLKKKCPWAKRVHRVYGSDASHKAAAELSSTDRFITVDADTIVHPNFFNETIPTDISNDNKVVISWSSKNAVNGLIYGNGSLKSWTKDFVINMKTHENSTTPKNRIEFCFEDGYEQRNEIYSTTYPNASPKQAFRSGFREGVKMCLDQGFRIPRKKFPEDVYWKNLIRLLVWCSVGADVQNGLWCIYGARYGCELTMLSSWDYINVRDFEYINRIWDTNIAPKYEDYASSDMCTNTGYCWNNEKLLEDIKEIGNKLRRELDLNVADIDGQASKFFRSVFINPKRVEE
jgi:hypothetical protein